MKGANLIKGFVFSPVGGRYAYVSYGNDGYHMVVDGKESPRYYSAIDNTITFSPDGKHYAYAAYSNLMTVDIVTDGSALQTGGIGQFFTRSTPRFGFPSLIYSPDSSRLAFAKQTRDTPLTWLINGEEFARGQTWESPMFSPTSKHFAVLTWNGKGYAVVADGKMGPAYEEIIEVHPNCVRFEGPGVYRFLGIKGGSVYRVTVDLGG
jgi:hypothetical protein